MPCFVSLFLYNIYMSIEFNITKSTTLGEILRVARQRKELKVYELAKLVKVNPVYITQIEKDYKLPSPETFMRILEILNVNLIAFNEIEDRFMKIKYPDYSKTYGLFNDYLVKHFASEKKTQDKLIKEAMKEKKRDIRIAKRNARIASKLP